MHLFVSSAEALV